MFALKFRRVCCTGAHQTVVDYITVCSITRNSKKQNQNQRYKKSYVGSCSAAKREATKHIHVVFISLNTHRSNSHDDQQLNPLDRPSCPTPKKRNNVQSTKRALSCAVQFVLNLPPHNTIPLFLLCFPIVHLVY